jgi:hypothetical protein
MNDTGVRVGAARNWPRGAGASILIAMCVMIACGTAVANSASHPPAYAYEVGHAPGGEHQSWSVWIYGNAERRQCWWTQVVTGGLPQRYETCGYTVPRSPWQLASVGAVSRHRSVLFFLTRPHIRSLKVRLEMAKERSYRVISVRVHTLSARQARAARLHSPIGYGLAVIQGHIARVASVKVK